MSAADIYWVAVCYPYLFLSPPLTPISPHYTPFSFVIPKINYIFVCG